MRVKKCNEVFGWGYLVLGITKFIFVITVLVKLIGILNGNNGSVNSSTIVSTVIGFGQIILGIGSIIMIILNLKDDSKAVKGYLFGIAGTIIEFIVPSFLYIFCVFIECGLYVTAGMRLRAINEGEFIGGKNTNQILKDTEWFYGKEEDK